MKKLQVVQNKIIRTVYEGDRYTSNTSIHMALGVTTLNEMERASTELYQRIRQNDKPVIATAGNCDIHTHCSCTRPKQILH
jgi:Icc-related predicted phosphoesterase